MMKIGVVLPQLEIAARDIRHYTQSVEQMGFDYLLAYDHVIGANPREGWSGPYTHESQFHEILTLFSYMAGFTERLEFTSGILILPQRQTVLVAKQTAQIDVLSGGRLRLGVAVGWNPVEYEALNEDFSTRGSRIEEQIEVMRQLWTKPLVTFNGSEHTITDAGLNPMPVQQPIPIWFGGGADVVLRRMAKLGNGWMPSSIDPQQAMPKVEKIRQYLQEYERSDFGIDVVLTVRRFPRETWDAYIDGWQRLGMTHLCINTMGLDYTDVQQHLDHIAEFKDYIQRFTSGPSTSSVS
jgi:probable F420-dependent oxidoreductase